MIYELLGTNQGIEGDTADDIKKVILLNFPEYEEIASSKVRSVLDFGNKITILMENGATFVYRQK